MNVDLMESVKTALGCLERRQIEGDIWGTAQQTVVYSIQKGKLSDSSETEDVGLGIRVLREGAVGFGYSVPGKEERGVERALELSRISPRSNIQLPTPEKVYEVPVFDRKIAQEIEEGRGTELAHKIVEGVSSVKSDIMAASGELIMILCSRVAANTNGVFLKEESTIMSCGVHTIILGEQAPLTAREIRSSRQFNIDFEDVGVEAGKKVDAMREKSKVVQATFPVIMSPDVFAPLLWFAGVSSFLGENVRKGTSGYRERMGSYVSSATLTIMDDPVMPWGLGSGAFDDEGVASSTTTLVDRGMLKSYLYNLEESAKSNTQSTGNGVRADFKKLPETRDRNIVLKGEEHKRETFLEEEVLYLDKVMGSHTANPVSGNFSVAASPALLIEHGEVKGRKEGVMISGNILELLKGLNLANDYKNIYFMVGSRKLFSMQVPTVRTRDVAVSWS